MLRFKKLYLITLLCMATSICLSGNYFDNDTLKHKPKSTRPKPIPIPKPKKEVKYTNFQFGGGMMGSVLYLSRNIKEKNDAKGLTIVANYGGHKLLRFSVQYTNYFPINIEPTWYNIKANTIEANVEVIARFKNDHTILYPYAGLSYNTFKGYFTGLDDYLNLRERYKINTTVSNKWLGLNVGTGIEHSFGPVVIFGDYKMRVGVERAGGVNTINIMDVCYSAGIRIKVSVITLKSAYHSMGDRYHWF
ncbi:MAG TPA: hypothetical protein VN026_15435 [Bacteroidia bacterium]|nr:hypothetical protein [Bacteroidia bacterium]